ncbi:rod shape-determining protein RodA [Patescibacteria group bacterium]|nr:rod shape-determining protein RodA [Patescibacteria group bacterium]MDE2173412.1 rod shape-determining protein RodA [Patescibacteria group bacterium]
MSLRVRRLRFFFDWTLLLPALALSFLGILTMSTFGQGASLAPRQLLWLAISVCVYFGFASFDARFIRRTSIVMTLYFLSFILLAFLLLFAHPILGARAWFSLGPVSFQPADLAKLALIALLAKYLSRRHVEIGDFRHIIVSGAYALTLMLLILIEPDMGNAIIFGALWLGMMLVSGISKKHLAVLGLLGLVVGSALWFGGLKPYQRARIVSFVNPAGDIHGAGYNAYQAKIAVGSGELFGKGIGYGTQSKLRFLPEYQTDFIFAAYAEEWGFVGVLLLLAGYALLFVRLAQIARASATNFDAFFTLGVLILFIAHVAIHAGISLGLLPVTGTTIPFMSSGGSHLVLEFAALGIITSLAHHGRGPTRDLSTNEYFGG